MALTGKGLDDTGSVGQLVQEYQRSHLAGYLHCGTQRVGWMRGVHPTTPAVDQVVAAISCFNVGGGGGDCAYRYCSSHWKNLQIPKNDKITLYDKDVTENDNIFH